MRINLIQLGLHVSIFLLLLFCFIPAGCSLNTSARMLHSKVLMAQYREKQLPELLAYFYCGRENLPYAVVGIDPAYTFESKFWFPVEFGADLYCKIDHLADLEPGQDTMYARSIIGPAGNAVGVWFSFYPSTGVVVDDTRHTIQVFNPYKPESMFNFF